MHPPASNPDHWPFVLETGVRVTFKVGNLSSKFGLARLLGFRIIGQSERRTDGRTDKSNAYCSVPGGIIVPMSISMMLLEEITRFIWWMSNPRQNVCRSFRQANRRRVSHPVSLYADINNHRFHVLLQCVQKIPITV